MSANVDRVNIFSFGAPVNDEEFKKAYRKPACFILSAYVVGRDEAAGRDFGRKGRLFPVFVPGL